MPHVVRAYKLQLHLIGWVSYELPSNCPVCKSVQAWSNTIPVVGSSDPQSYLLSTETILVQYFV